MQPTQRKIHAIVAREGQLPLAMDPTNQIPKDDKEGSDRPERGKGGGGKTKENEEQIKAETISKDGRI